MKICKVSSTACVAAVLLFIALSCNGTTDVPTGYRIPSIIKTYFAFGNGSHWEYEIDSSGKLEHVELEEIQNGIDIYRDEEVVKYKLKSDNTEWIEAYIGGEPRVAMVGEKGGAYYFETNRKQDSVTGRFWGTSDTMYYLDSSIINGRTFHSVLVAKIPQNSLCEIWLAPKVGIIKKVYDNGSVYLLKSYEIK